MDQYDSLGFDPCDKKTGGGSAQSGRLHTEEEIYRSMKINDTSKTPYSDATQVSRLAPSPPPFQNLLWIICALMTVLTTRGTARQSEDFT